jgi:hypothetical protein
VAGAILKMLGYDAAIVRHTCILQIFISIPVWVVVAKRGHYDLYRYPYFLYEYETAFWISLLTRIHEDVFKSKIISSILQADSSSVP